MMSVKEYALDVNLSVEEIINKAKELGYNISSEDDMLSEDQIIDLDNIISINVKEVEDENTYLEEDVEEKDYDLDEELEDKAEELASASHIKFDETAALYLQKTSRLTLSAEANLQYLHE